MSTALDLDLDVCDSLDFSIPCEGLTHQAGCHGHNPDQAAAYLLVVFCCNASWALCADRTAYLRARPGISCTACGTTPARWEALPIDRSGQ